MSNVYDFSDKAERSLSGRGEPPDNGDMETRVAKLEAIAEKTLDRLTVIERDLAVIKVANATKEDLHRELHANTWRVIGAMLTFGTLLTAITYYIARNVH